MKILRTPDDRFEGITDFPYQPNYTNIKTKDGSDLRIHHIDEGPKDGPILSLTTGFLLYINRLSTIIDQNLIIYIFIAVDNKFLENI